MWYMVPLCSIRLRHVWLRHVVYIQCTTPAAKKCNFNTIIYLLEFGHSSIYIYILMKLYQGLFFFIYKFVKKACVSSKRQDRKDRESKNSLYLRILILHVGFALEWISIINLFGIYITIHTSKHYLKVKYFQYCTRHVLKMKSPKQSLSSVADNASLFQRESTYLTAKLS